MLRGLWELTWLETKIFVREPLGVFGTVGIPVLTFILMGRLFGGRPPAGERVATLLRVQMPILAIYREAGILKRLRATPLRPHTILTAQVLVKLLFTLITMGLLLLAGKRYYPVPVEVPAGSVALALVVSTLAILSMGFLIASLVPTARFAQPIGTVILYPMIALSGLFAPIATLPPALRIVARLLPLTYTTSLLQGIWLGEPWSAHAADLAALAAVFGTCTALSAKVFRWE